MSDVPVIAPHAGGDGAFDVIIGELRALGREVPADPGVCVAILDGPVDLSHPCFRGARLRRVDTLITEDAGTGPMSAHGTHVASIVFGQPSSGTLGLAAGCRGLAIPVFRDSSGHLSQLDLARAIERAVTEGAHVVNISGGEHVPHGQPDPLLARAIKLCEHSGVLVVAATGNDGCECVHVPAALQTVLAVGALDRDGLPVRSSNFGGAYRSNGVLAPGEGIPGAAPGGAIVPFTGSSFATPIVSALAALLLCEQRRRTGELDVATVRDAIWASALPCGVGAEQPARCLGGILSVRGAHALITQGDTVTEFDGTTRIAAPGDAPTRRLAGVVAAAAPEGESQLPPMDPGPPPPSPMNPGSIPPAAEQETPVHPMIATAAPGGVAGTAAPPAQIMTAPEVTIAAPAAVAAPAVVASGGPSCSCGGAGPSGQAPPPAEAVRPASVNRIFAIGNIGFDFGTEARRDTFRQLMPRVVGEGEPPVLMAPNPYDTKQLADYLAANPYESTKIIWTLNLDLAPVYAIEAEVTYADYVYQRLRDALRYQSLPTDDENFISRVSLPGVLTTRTVRLFSGQVVPVVVTQPRGLYLWSEATLIDAVVAAVDSEAERAAPVRLKVRQMLDKVYYELRNLGTASPDRAINFMATNAFVFTEGIAQGLLSGETAVGDSTNLYSLDSIAAVKSPYCRIDSDCWDVQISFFDPENDRRARVVFQTTIDVSDELPVQLAPTHQFLFAG